MQPLLSGQNLRAKVRILLVDRTATSSLRCFPFWGAVFEILAPFALPAGWTCTTSWSVDVRPAVWEVGVVTCVATTMMACGAGWSGVPMGVLLLV